MSQARRQRREMYKRFGLLGNKSPQAKQIRNYLKQIRENANFENGEGISEDIENTPDEIIEVEEIIETEENGTEQEG
jgi:hypothetical protein